MTTSRGFLTSFVLPMVTSQRIEKDENGELFKNTRVYHKHTDMSTKTTPETRSSAEDKFAKILTDTNEYLKLRRLLLCLIHINSKKKFNIAIFTNLSSHNSETNTGRQNLNILKKIINNNIGSKLRRKGYNLTTYQDYIAANTDNVTLDTVSERYINFGTNKNIILYGYNDIALAGKDYFGDCTYVSSTDSGIRGMDFKFNLTDNLPAESDAFSKNTLGPLGSDGDFLMSIINSPFKHTIYLNKDLEILNKRIIQIFNILEDHPTGLVAIPKSARNFCQYNENSVDKLFNLNKNNLGARIGYYSTELIGLNKDNKYVLPFLETIKQNFVMMCMRWDKFFKYIHSRSWDELENKIHYGLRLGDSDLTSEGYYYPVWSKSSSINKDIDNIRSLYNGFLNNQTTDEIGKTELKISSTDSKGGFIDMRGDRCSSKANKIISNLQGNYTNKNRVVADQSIRDKPPASWSSPESRGYVVLEDFTYGDYNDTDEEYLKVIHPSSGDVLGSMLYAAAFNYGDDSTEQKASNIFDFKLWDDDTTSLEALDDTKCIFYELPFYTMVKDTDFINSLVLINELNEIKDNFSVASTSWKISRSVHLIKQLELQDNRIISNPISLIENIRATLRNIFDSENIGEVKAAILQIINSDSSTQTAAEIETGDGTDTGISEGVQKLGEIKDQERGNRKGIIKLNGEVYKYRKGRGERIENNKNIKRKKNRTGGENRAGKGKVPQKTDADGNTVDGNGGAVS